jgi:hypothetical protein
MPVAELLERVSYAEALHWIAVYTAESDEALPPSKRPVRARTPEEGAKLLDKIFKINRN